MAALLTTAGTTHLTELDATWPTPVTTNDFDALVFGVNNAAPDAADTQAEIEPEGLGLLQPVEAGYPVLGDDDPRNTGRGATWYTWKFVVPAGNPLVASNLAVTNLNGGILADAEDLFVHEKVQVYSKFDEDLIVWLNAKTGSTPNFVVAHAARVVSNSQRLQTWTARARALRTAPVGVRLTGNRVRCAPPRQHPVWTAALLDGCGGDFLTCSEVRRAELEVRRWDADAGRWRSQRQGLDKHAVVTSGTVVGDSRWPGGEFNFSHEWRPQRGYTEGTYELRYTLELADGSDRTVDVEVRY